MSSDGEISDDSDREKKKKRPNNVSSSTSTSSSSSSVSDNSDAYDRPMWKKKKEKKSNKEKQSRSRSRDRRKKRRYRKCSSSSCDSSISRERIPRKMHNQYRRNGREYHRKRKESENETNWRCRKCGKRKASLKGLVHHEMNEHGLRMKCASCSTMCDTNDEFRKHYELEHPKDRVQCVYCKCTFEEPREMNDKRWDFIFGHVYGENLYARLAEYEEINNNGEGDL